MVLGYKLVKADEAKRLQSEAQGQEELNVVQSFYAQRPTIDKIVQRDSTGVVIQVYPFTPVALYEMARNVDALRISLETLRREMFRNNLTVKPVYAYKCTNCGKEFESKPQNESGMDECDECGNNTLARPEPKHRQFLMSLLKKPVNNNKQTLKDVGFQIEWDLEVKDDGIMLVLKDYEIDESTGLIKSRTIKEILRADPLQVFLIADNQGRIGFEEPNMNNYNTQAIGVQQRVKPVLVCPRTDHRTKRLVGDTCDMCGAKGVLAIAGMKSYYGVNQAPQTQDYFYIEGELITGSKYQPSLLYGFSPIYALWMKVMTLYYMDKYMMTYYDKQRSPRAIFAVATRSLQSFTKAWDQVKKWAESDPEQVHPLAIESDRTGKSIVQFIDLMRSLDEMQFIEARNEFRRTIGAHYGVLPLFSGDLPDGWNNEGMQVTVTNRAVAWGQEVLQEKFFDKLVQMMGIKDWRIVFEPSEEMDKLRELQIEGQMLANAEAYKRLGFNVWFDHTGNLMHDKLPMDMMMGYNPTMGNGTNPMGELGEKRSNAPVEELGRFEGEPNSPRPSDVGGIAEGHPASGEGTSLSMKSAPAGTGTIDIIQKSMEMDSGFNLATVSKAIADMKLDASRQAWQFDYVDVGKPMQKDIRRIVQLMFTHNVNRSTAQENLIRIGLPSQQAELIVKTEFNLMLNRARELAYKQSDPDGDIYKYYWDVHKDGKVCPICYAIAKQSADGVSIDQLKAIIRKVSKEYKVKASARVWHAHPADRCLVKRMK